MGSEIAGVLLEIKQVYRVKVGGTYWFEYHCWESDESSDADLWYHSHQRATVLHQTQRGYGADENQRCDDGHCAHYLVQFADGATFEAGEDELLDDPADFCRPDPPPPRAQRKSKRSITLKESIVDRLLESDDDRRQLKKLFKPGTCWTRINYHFPFKSYGPDGQLTVTPPGTPVPITVQRVLPDGIAFQLPSGETSHLAWPDGVNARSNLTMSGGLILFDKNGRELLSYQPCAT